MKEFKSLKKTIKKLVKEELIEQEKSIMLYEMIVEDYQEMRKDPNSANKQDILNFAEESKLI